MLHNRTDKIEYLLTELRQLYYIVQNCHDLIERLEGSEVQDVYIEETIPLVQDHNTLRKELLKEFESHFEWERKTRQPRNLRYRRLYNEMMKDKDLTPVPPTFSGT